MRSQSRTHAGKRAAAQRKARREGYAQARINPHWWTQYSHVEREAMFAILGAVDWPGSPNLAAAYRHGAHDFARKHAEPAP